MVSNVLVLISGPSGVGKSEITKRLLSYQDLNSQYLTAFTTRQPRQGEMDGEELYFISKEEFLKKVADNQFLYYIEYSNNYYGNLLNSLKKGLLTKNILQIVNVEGFQQVKKAWEGKIISFWLQPPNRDKLLSNLRKRGGKEEDILKRLAIAETEIPFGKEYDHIFTVNDNLDQVAQEIKTKILSSIEQHKSQQEQQQIAQIQQQSPYNI